MMKVSQTSIRHIASRLTVKAALVAMMLFAVVLAASMFAGCSNTPEETNPAGAPSSEISENEPDGVPAEPIPGIPAERVENGDDSSDQIAASETSTKPTISDKANELLVRFLDVGQGDAILITCNGHHMLVDGGPPSESSKMYSILRRLEIDNLDVVIATHPDADHCGGIAGALNYAKCRTFYCPVTNYETRAFENILSHLNSSVTIPSYGDSFALGNAEIQFINPLSAKEPRNNNGSLVCLLTYGKIKFLFTGDAETESEAAMLNERYALDADVLKVGHHGSSTSSSATFLNAVSPAYAVISVGENNYGHPAESTIQLLNQQSTEILRTDDLGTITFFSDGETVEFTSSTGLVEE